MRLGSLAVVRKRAGRGESGPVAAKALRRMRGSDRALSSNVRASCGTPVMCFSVAIVVLVLVWMMREMWMCVFITAGPSKKLFACGGGICATRDDEPRPVWTSLPITH
jgi:hypothetical protein